MKQALKAHSFAHIRRPFSLKSCGSRLALCVKEANLSKNHEENTLWLLQDKQLRVLHTGIRVQNFWWKDENCLWLQGVSKDEASLNTLYEYSLAEAGDAKAVARLQAEAEDIFFLENESYLCLLREEERALPKGALKEDSEHYALLDEYPFWQEGEDFFCKRRRRLFLFKKGEKGDAVSAPELEVEECLLSKNKKRLWFTAKDTFHRPSASNALYCLDVENAAVQALPLPTHSFVVHGMCELDTDELLVFGSDMCKHGLNQNGAFYSYSHETACYTVLYEGEEHGCWSSVVSDVQAATNVCLCARDKSVIFVSTQRGAAHLFSLHCESKEIRALACEQGSITEISVLGDAVYYLALRKLAGPELYCLQEKEETRISDWNVEFSRRYHVQEPREILVKKAEMGKVQGWILPPAYRKKDKKSAAVLMVHGGPKMAFGPVLSHEMQYLSSLGYAVLFCNPRGSDGYGDAFSDIRGRYGHEDCEDLLSFLKTALEQNPWIDPQRVGICGGSYGGFAVNWLLSQTKQFAAAVSVRGICNWLSMAALSDIGHVYVKDQVADPWQQAEVAMRCSPLFYAKDIETPVLFLHGAQDHRCPAGESLQLYSALKQVGVPTRLCLFLKEGHGFAQGGHPRARICYLKEMAAWFAKYLDE